MLAKARPGCPSTFLSWTARKKKCDSGCLDSAQGMHGIFREEQTSVNTRFWNSGLEEWQRCRASVSPLKISSLGRASEGIYELPLVARKPVLLSTILWATETVMLQQVMVKWRNRGSVTWTAGWHNICHITCSLETCSAGQAYRDLRSSVQITNQRAGASVSSPYLSLRRQY